MKRALPFFKADPTSYDVHYVNNQAYESLSRLEPPTSPTLPLIVEHRPRRGRTAARSFRRADAERHHGGAEIAEGRAQRDLAGGMQHALIATQLHLARVVGKPNPGAEAAEVAQHEGAVDELDAGMAA